MGARAAREKAEYLQQGAYSHGEEGEVRPARLMSLKYPGI